MSFFRLCRHFPQCSAERTLFFRIFIHVDHSCKMIGFLLLLLISCVIFFDIISSYLWFYSNFSKISFHCHLAILSRRPLSCLINQTVKYHSTSAFHLVSRGRNLPLQVFILGQEKQVWIPACHWLGVHFLASLMNRYPFWHLLYILPLNIPLPLQVCFQIFLLSALATALGKTEPETLTCQGHGRKGPVKSKRDGGLWTHVCPGNHSIFRDRSGDSPNHSDLERRTHIGFGGDLNLKWPQRSQTEVWILSRLHLDPSDWGPPGPLEEDPAGLLSSP